MPETARFVDTGEWIWDFCEQYLVTCPRCEGRAQVVPRDAAQAELFAPWRLLCTGCGLIREMDGQPVIVGVARDAYFNLPLWLQTACCGETLWAHNRRHLEWLEAFVGAKLREQERDPQYGWSNQSMANRLPRWMKAGKNRAEILRAIEKLKERCP